jgi:uncharacterized RmlC-like cupin family protein
MSVLHTVDDCRMIKLQKIERPQGNLTPVEGMATIPFPIARVFYLYDIPVDSSRGGHAHKDLQQAIVCVMGSFDMVLQDGTDRRVVTLRRGDEALYVPSMIWGELVNFSSGAVCFTLASLPYDEDDYLRTYDAFVAYRRQLEQR